MTETVIAAGKSSPDRLARTVRLMNEAFPDSRVLVQDDQIKGLSLPDEDDLHVVAAALSAGAQYIVTFNVDNFPVDDIGTLDVEILTPDQFVLTLYRTAPEDVVLTLVQQFAGYRQPPITFGALLDGLASHGLPEFSYTVREETEPVELETAVDDFRRSDDDDG